MKCTIFLISLLLTFTMAVNEFANFNDPYFFNSYPDHEIEIYDTDLIIPQRELDDQNYNTFEMDGPNICHGGLITCGSSFYKTKKSENSYEEGMKPVVEKYTSEEYAPNAKAVSYVKHHTTKGVKSSVTYHGDDESEEETKKKKKLKIPHVFSSGSFHFRGKKFEYNL